jgi:hypothetical protein
MSIPRSLIPRLAATFFLLAAVDSTLLNAQTASVRAAPMPPVASDTMTGAAQAGPRIARAAFHAPAVAKDLTPPVLKDASLGAGKNVALMGVGAAGLITGLLVGGDAGTAIAIGGSVIGLFGLYHYLR